VDRELGLPLCQSRLLLAIPHVRHGITRRVEGMGKAHGNIGFSEPRDRDDAAAMRALWRRALGLERSELTRVHQVHGADVFVARPEALASPVAPKADALIAAERGPALLTVHADCMPIIVCDPDAPAVATIHAGWRGTTLDVAGGTVRRMAEEFNAKPERMIAFLGPSIGQCCYEVGSDVVDAWHAIPSASAANAIRPRGARWTFDLNAANRWLLQRAGLRDDLIESSGICTRCGGEAWFSHRGQGPLTGRFGSIVALV
jgi:YfiH family protein